MAGAAGAGMRRNECLSRSTYTWRNPGFAQTDEHPVVNVSWNDAIAFCNMLGDIEGLKPYYQSGKAA